MTDARMRLASLSGAAMEPYCVDLGRNMMMQQDGAPMGLEAALVMVRDAFEGDHAFGDRLVSILGWDNLIRHKPKVSPPAMPLRAITAMEVTIGDNPPKPSQAKQVRTRPLREALRYRATLNCYTPASKGLGDPSWSGSAQLRTPERAVHDLKELADPKKCLTPFSAEYAEWIMSEIVPFARDANLLIGFMMTQPKGSGTYYHEFQVFMIDADGLAKGEVDKALIYARDGDGAVPVLLPKFDPRYSNGKSLAGTFILQSRGVKRADTYADWQTGLLT